MLQSRPLFDYFRPFHITNHVRIEKAEILCLVFEPGADVWKTQMDPFSYGGYLSCLFLSFILIVIVGFEPRSIQLRDNAIRVAWLL